MAHVTVGTGLGQQAPDFTLPSIDGKQVSLSQYRGKPLMIFMWASW